jgi:hypothetical protein
MEDPVSPRVSRGRTGEEGVKANLAFVPPVTLECTEHVRECPPEGKPAARFVPEDGAQWLESHKILPSVILRCQR